MLGKKINKKSLDNCSILQSLLANQDLISLIITNYCLLVQSSEESGTHLTHLSRHLTTAVTSVTSVTMDLPSPDKHLTQKQLDSYKEAFSLFDGDRDGKINREELEKVTKCNEFVKNKL